MKARRQNIRGVTLTETLVTAAVISIIMATVTAGMYTLQRSFAASQDFTAAHLEQVRALDEMKRDARAAGAASVQNSGATVTFTIPTTEPGLRSFQLPASMLGLLTATPPAATTKTVTYALAAQRLTRTEAANVRVIATRQTSFHAELVGTEIQTTLAFLSPFTNQPAETPASTIRADVLYRTGNE